MNLVNVNEILANKYIDSDGIEVIPVSVIRNAKSYNLVTQQCATWIELDCGIARCSACGRIGNSMIDNYCANCGSRMLLNLAIGDCQYGM